MQTSQRYRQLPSQTDEQTMLDDFIKLNWYHDTKSRKHFYTETVKPLVDNRDSQYPEYGFMGVSVRAFEVQKSNVVIKTAEEALEIYRLLVRYFDPEDYPWADQRTSNAFMRRRREIKDGLEEQGYSFQRPTGSWVENLITPDGDIIDLTGPDLQINIKK